MSSTIDLGTLSYLTIRFYDRERDAYEVSLCPTQRQHPRDTACITAVYERSDPYFSLEGIKLLGQTWLTDSLSYVPDKPGLPMRPLVPLEIRRLEETILRPARTIAEEHLDTLSTVDALDESLTITSNPTKPNTHDVNLSLLQGGRVFNSRLVCEKKEQQTLVSLFFILNLSDPKTGGHHTYTSAFVFSDPLHLERLPDFLRGPCL